MNLPLHGRPNPFKQVKGFIKFPHSLVDQSVIEGADKKRNFSHHPGWTKSIFQLQLIYVAGNVAPTLLKHRPQSTKKKIENKNVFSA